MNIHQSLTITHATMAATMIMILFTPPHNPWWIDPLCAILAALNVWAAYYEWRKHLELNRQ